MWLYEQPQTTPVSAGGVTSVEVLMTAQTPPDNARNATENTVIQESTVPPHIPGTESPFNPNFYQ
jgi:hypothetical protein